MTRGEVWLAQVGRKKRPVVILTRPEVIDVRALVTVAEITTSVRGLAVEVEISDSAGVERASVVNCDGIHTVARASLTTRVGRIEDAAMREICSAIGYALAC